MIEKLRKKILAFISSPKDVPLLAGFSIGIYMVLYYYSKNFGLANSWQQLLFFTTYYMLLPITVIYAGYKFFSKAAFAVYKRHFLFVATIGFMGFYLLQLSFVGMPKKGIFIAFIVVVTALSFKFKNYYKFFVLLILFLSLFNITPVLRMGYIAVTSSSEWKEQPDAITKIVFKETPNIYYIQPDGYTSFKNLRDSNHNFDNSAFESFLTQNGFTLYDDYRSNYFSTLLSNTSMFSMKHHYLERNIDAYAARGIIIGDNPVLDILKHNGYKTHFVTEKPYLIINRPKMGYDDCNIDYFDMPFIKDGWDDNQDLKVGLEDAMMSQQLGGNFYFIEKMLPGHIHGLKIYSEGAVKEKKIYLEAVKQANMWLTETIRFIEQKDPDALIIIAADHGGFVGLDYTLQSLEHTHNKQLVHAIFGAVAAIKWNSPVHTRYDERLKTSVNLFRTVFSFLARDTKYLSNLQENGSYIHTQKPAGNYRYIDNEGKIVFDKIK